MKTIVFPVKKEPELHRSNDSKCPNLFGTRTQFWPYDGANNGLNRNL